MTKPLIVHLDDEDHDRVRRWAVREDRSMSAQVRHAIKAALPDDLEDDDGAEP